MTDATTLEILRHALEGVADEMGAVLKRTAYSPNIKEREDFSAAVFSPDGDLVAQAEHIPVHLGSMPASVAAAIDAFPQMRDGDQIALNEPFAGGTHLNDITIVAPVFADGSLIGYVANRAHHTDVGGDAPGSIPAGATDIAQEGLRIPPTLLNEELVARIKDASRTPDEREGDLHAQSGANARGAARLRELAAELGIDALLDAERALDDYADARVRAALADLPRGEWTFADLLDDDGAGTTDIAIRCALRIGDTIEIDLSESDPQVRGNVNSVHAVALSAACFVLRCLVPQDIPVNAGCWRVLRVITKEGTVVAARPPAAVGAGNVETSQRITDAIFGAFAQAVPSLVPAASQGTMNNVLIGGSGFSYYETIAGGAGAAPWGDGASAVHTNMTNTRNTPIEALEHAYAFRAVRYSLREGSGGAGQHRGGDGVVREIQILAPDATVTLITERRRRGPWGIGGAPDGAPGRNLIDGEEVAPKVTRAVPSGTTVRIETPGGGGWGRKRLRHGYTNETEIVGGIVRKRYAGPWASEPRFRTEARALDALSGHVPAPGVVARDPERLELSLELVEGVNGQELIRRGDADGVLASLGRTLRAMHDLGREVVTSAADGSGDVLVHGDFGPQNAVFDPETLELRALVDWEWCHIGSSVEDLAWCEWILRAHHPESVRSMEAFFESYGERPAWHLRHAAMVARCTEILAAVEGAAGKERWRARVEMAERFVER